MVVKDHVSIEKARLLSLGLFFFLYQSAKISGPHLPARSLIGDGLIGVRVKSILRKGRIGLVIQSKLRVCV